MDQRQRSTLRSFLMKFFDDNELRYLTSDYFRDVFNEFTTGMTKSQMVHLLIEYCYRRNRIYELLTALKRERERIFDQYFPDFYIDKAIHFPSNPRNPKQIFVSHAHQDAEFAHKIATDLQHQGWQVWIAPDSIYPGEKWLEAIGRGLEECSIFILLITPDAVRSQWVKDETNIAIQLEKSGKLSFIPVLVKATKTPIMWQAYQFLIFKTDYSAGLDALLLRLNNKQAPPITPHPIEDQSPEKIKVSDSIKTYIRTRLSQISIKKASVIIIVFLITLILIINLSQLPGYFMREEPVTQKVMIGTREVLSTPFEETPTQPQFTLEPRSSPTSELDMAINLNSPSLSTPTLAVTPQPTSARLVTPPPTANEQIIISTPIGEVKQIAFTSGYHIYLTNIYGSEKTRLIRDYSYNNPLWYAESNPSWSPDGSKIAFILHSSFSSWKDKPRIYVINSDGTHLELLLQIPVDEGNPVRASSIAWSPDGSQIAYSASNGSYDGYYGEITNWGIFIMNSDGTNPKLLRDIGTGGSSLDWSPDGEKLIFAAGRQGSELYEIIINNPEPLPKRLTYSTYDIWSGSTSPKYSPDGFDIAYTYHTKELYDDIYIISSDSTQNRQLTTNDTDDLYPDWSSDGSKIIFASERNNKWGIYMIDSDGYNETLIYDNGAEPIRDIAWQP